MFSVIITFYKITNKNVNIFNVHKSLFKFTNKKSYIFK